MKTLLDNFDLIAKRHNKAKFQTTE